MTKRSVFLAGCVLMVSALVASPGMAQCSGRCLIHPQTLEAYCSLSVFGQVICFEGMGYCAEYACPDGLTSAGGLQVSHFVQCRQASAPPLPHFEPKVIRGTIQVVELKSRT